jgi:UDP-glucose 4-epimerase
VTDEVFNVGTGIQTSLNELCDLLLELTDSSLRPEHREARKVANVQTRRAAVDKAALALDFRANVCLRDGLQELIRWRKNRISVDEAVETR